MDTHEFGSYNGCAHHWRIAAPAGAYSKGICAKCGVERDFPNSSESSTFGYGRTKPKAAR